MDFTLFIKGILTGLAVAAPVGPIGILCIQRTLARGREIGLVSFLGAATADALYGLIVVSGLFFIQAFLEHNQGWLQLGGGAFLCLLGFRTFFAHPHPNSHAWDSIGLIRAYTSSFFLALTSPATLIWMIVVLVALRVAHADGNHFHSAILGLGIFLGSASWWLVLAGSMTLLRIRRDRNLLLWVNRIGGALLAGFGVLIFLKLIF